MGVNDVSAAFRRFAWNTDVLRYTGMVWRDVAVSDARLSFGSSAAPAICQFFTRSVVETIARRARDELHLLDDDFMIEVYLDDIIHAASSKAACEALEQLVRNEFGAHGLSLKATKSQGPAVTRVVYLGWQLCTATETMSLTALKASELRMKCERLLEARGVRSRDVKRVAGSLQWAAAVMPGAPCRLQSLWAEVASRGHRPQRPRALRQRTRRDIEWFVAAFRLAGLPGGEAVSVQCHFQEWAQSVIVITDAAGDLDDPRQSGFGALVIGPDEIRVFQQAWSPELLAVFESLGQDSSVLRESLASYLAAVRSKDLWCLQRTDTGRGLPVLFITDSMSSACVMLKGASRLPRVHASSPLSRSLLNDLSRDLADMFAEAKCDYAAWWVRRDEIAGVDWLSRTNRLPARHVAASRQSAATWKRARRIALGEIAAAHAGQDRACQRASRAPIAVVRETNVAARTPALLGK